MFRLKFAAKKQLLTESAGFHNFLLARVTVSVYRTPLCMSHLSHLTNVRRFLQGLTGSVTGFLVC